MSYATIGDVYAFLGKNTDWYKRADEDFGDKNTVVEGWEFSKYIKSAWDGESTLTKDIINQFWQRIDTNTSAAYVLKTDGSGEVSNATNSGALDEDEMKALEESAKLYKAKQDYWDEHSGKEISVPTQITTNETKVSQNREYSSRWLSGVKSDLNDAVEEAIKEGKTADELADYLDTKLNAILIDNTAIQSEALNKAIATSNSTLGINYNNYSFGDQYDKELKEIIEKADATDLNGLYDDIKTLIDKYIAKIVKDDWTINISRSSEDGSVSGSVTVALTGEYGKTFTPTSYSIISGDHGLKIDSTTGEITNTPDTEDGFAMMVKVTYTDAAGNVGSKQTEVKIPAKGAKISGGDEDPEETEEVTKEQAIANASWQNSSTNLEVFGGNLKEKQGLEVTSYNFAELYNGGYYIQLDYGDTYANGRGYDACKSVIESQLSQLGSRIVEALANSGLDADKLAQAAKTVVETYMSWGDTNTDRTYGANGGDEMRNSFLGEHNTSANGIQSEWQRKLLCNTNLWAVSFTSFVDDILKVYYGGKVESNLPTS